MSFRQVMIKKSYNTILRVCYDFYSVRREAVGYFFFDDSIYAVDSPPDNPKLLVASGEDGTVQVVDVRSPLERTKLAASSGSYHSAVFHPINSQYIATANSLHGVSLWDIRKPLKILKKVSTGSGMSVRFNILGTRLLALYRKGGPVVYKLDGSNCEKEISHRMNHEKYQNYCTMKSACFAGDKDEYVVSGSDDFNIYVWKIPDLLDERCKLNSPHFILEGHRSIVNQVRYNSHLNLLASAGVEKCIKLWSCFPLRDGEGDLTNDTHYTQRRKYTHEQYMEMTSTTPRMSHNYDDESVEEDPRMIALFDSLIERTHNDWASSDSDEGGGADAPDESMNNTRMQRILSLLLDAYAEVDNNSSSSSSSSSEEEDQRNEQANEQTQQTFGVSINELRRLFRSNDHTVDSELQDEERGTTNDDLSTSRESEINLQLSERKTDEENKIEHETSERCEKLDIENKQTDSKFDGDLDTQKEKGNDKNENETVFTIKDCAHGSVVDTSSMTTHSCDSENNLVKQNSDLSCTMIACSSSITERTRLCEINISKTEPIKLANNLELPGPSSSSSSTHSIGTLLSEDRSIEPNTTSIEFESDENVKKCSSKAGFNKSSSRAKRNYRK
ncbi:DDB1- and CUL4-associated factor 5-like isoform X2 [Clytia hemisphaerica]|uniref:DDB1- and CUL4-associated factor 5-like isoform X2 n=1 Tax=Clytia hemisphaerica TaxID=252671 RepID=UPI0034D6DA8F